MFPADKRKQMYTFLIRNVKAWGKAWRPPPSGTRSGDRMAREFEFGLFRIRRAENWKRFSGGNEFPFFQSASIYPTLFGYKT